MEFLRTPDERFENLPDFPYPPNYLNIPNGDDGLRMHYVEAGPEDGPVVLMLHGEPSWSFLYRKMIPSLNGSGFRTVAPDLIGFGRSDKPVERSVYSYDQHLSWLRAFMDTLPPVHLFCQDWGGLLGLRIVAEEPERFRSVAAANTFLPTGEHGARASFAKWRDYSQSVPEFSAGRIVRKSCVREVANEVVAAYDAPFPDERYKAGAREFPMLVPTEPDAPGAAENRRAWTALKQLQLPFLTCFSDSDPIMAGVDQILQAKIPGAAGQPHFTVPKAGHFLQEDAGDELGSRYAGWLSGLG